LVLRTLQAKRRSWKGWHHHEKLSPRGGPKNRSPAWGGAIKAGSYRDVGQTGRTVKAARFAGRSRRRWSLPEGLDLKKGKIAYNLERKPFYADSPYLIEGLREEK